ncbi:MAG: HlyC/CorC family transporter [Alphaproteobacteria bacterium]|nr:HlyC/CorC family transporter [Alphaproteobacteria bacterium]
MRTTILLSLVAIFFLLVISAFFSASETAMTTASKARLHHLERKGNPRAATIAKLNARRERMLGTVLIGNNLVNILSSALLTSVLISAFGDAGVAYATAIMTILVLVFAEILPKTYALLHAERVALAVAPLLRMVVAVVGPVSIAVDALVGFILRVLRVRAPKGAAVAHEELRGAIDLYGLQAGGRGERQMLGGILDLAHVDVSEIMVHRKNMFVLDAGLPPAKLLEGVLEGQYTRVPLYRDNPDNVVGVLHVKDVLAAITSHKEDIATLDIVNLAKEPWFVPSTTNLREQLQAFRSRKAHFALVVDEYGALMGLVTLEDILEEIVGDISDEFDVAAAGIRPQADGSYIVEGATTIRDLNRRFEWTLPDDEATTVAGLVLHEARTIPEAGQVFTFHGYRFEVLRRQRNQITLLRITPPRRPVPAAA